MLHRENKIRQYHITSAANLIKETMDYYHVTQTNLASRLGVSQKYISDILQRKEYLNANMALKLGFIMGISSQLLLNLDASFRLHLAKIRLSSQKSSLKKYSWVKA